MKHTRNLHSLGVTQLTSNQTAVPHQVMSLWDNHNHTHLEWHYNPLTKKVEVCPAVKGQHQNPSAQTSDFERCQAEFDCRD